MGMRNAILSIITWIEVWLVSITGVTVLFAVFPLVWPFDQRKLLLGRFYRLIAVTGIRLSPLWTFAQHGAVPRRIPGRTVVVSNHVSHLDSFLIATLPWEMKWLAKRSLFKVPFIGWGMWLIGDIGVWRGKGASIGLAMRKCADYLAKDVPIFIFPEGTRATSDSLLPFKDGAFRLAIETGAEILPLAVAGTQRGLPKHSWRFGKSHGIVKVGTPIATAGLELKDVDALRDQARAQIEAMLQVIRPLT